MVYLHKGWSETAVANYSRKDWGSENNALESIDVIRNLTASSTAIFQVRKLIINADPSEDTPGDEIGIGDNAADAYSSAYFIMENEFERMQFFAFGTDPEDYMRLSITTDQVRRNRASRTHALCASLCIVDSLCECDEPVYLCIAEANTEPILH